MYFIFVHKCECNLVLEVIILQTWKPNVAAKSLGLKTAVNYTRLILLLSIVVMLLLKYNKMKKKN